MSYSMEHRLHERIPIELEATVMDLTGEGKSEGGWLLDVSHGGVCVELPHALPLGNVVRVDCSEGCFFGQVIHATPEKSCFRVGVEVFTILLSASELSLLIERTLNASKTQRVAS